MARKKRGPKKTPPKRPIHVGKLLGGSSMSRMASLAVLIAIIIVILILFYKVMAGFVLPLFLAALFAVIFRPIHRWMLTRFRERDNVAAGLTTAAILCIVLLPLIGILGMAYYEGSKKLNTFDSSEIQEKLKDFGTKFGFNRPFELQTQYLDQHIIELPDKPPTIAEVTAGQVVPLLKMPAVATALRSQVDSHYARLRDREAGLADAKAIRELWKVNKERDTSDGQAVKRMKNKFNIYREATPDWKDVFGSKINANDDSESASDDDLSADAEATEIVTVPDEPGESPEKPAEEDSADEETVSEQDKEFPLDQLVAALNLTDEYFKTYASDPPKKGFSREKLITLNREFPKIKVYYLDVREKLMGGVTRMFITDVCFPTDDQFEQGLEFVQDYARRWIPSVTKNATSFAGQLAVGMAILVLGMFYFLRDGPGMIRAVMRLSPLDDRYEQELLAEFDSVSRAVVLATLFSAIAQGLLAAIGYYVAGFDSLFLLTMLTMMMAMVPVVGAGAVWIPACVWLAVVDNRLAAAGMLAVYGALVISMADNIVKPMVLHGQSNLHPLLALLSVLGGVTSLGPIGIIVGPMVVSFLQALLNMLHLELQAFDQDTAFEETT